MIPFLVSDTTDRRVLGVVCWLVAGYFVIASLVTWRNMQKESRILEAHLEQKEKRAVL